MDGNNGKRLAFAGGPRSQSRRALHAAVGWPGMQEVVGRYAGVEHHQARRDLRVGQNARLLHRLRLPYRGRALDDDLPADRRQRSRHVSSEDRGVRGGQQDSRAEDKKDRLHGRVHILAGG